MVATKGRTDGKGLVRQNSATANVFAKQKEAPGYEEEDLEVTELYKRIVIANAGNIVEWFDFAIFGFLTKDFGTLFFPDSDPANATIKAFSVYGGAFVMRPVGGVFFGHVGDVLGRKRAIELSIIMMTAAMLLMGVLPTYAQVGKWAPVCLVACRMFQGMSVGGQLVASICYTVESAPKGRKGLFGSLCLNDRHV